MDILEILILQSKNKGNVFISLYHIQFLSSIFYGFQSISILPHCLNLFLCILFFDVIINEIVFLIFFPDSFLLMCRNPTDFYMLILYPEVLVNLFLSSNSF